MKYSIATTALKTLFAAGFGGVYGALIQWALDGLTTGSWGMSPDTQAVTITLIVAGASAAHAGIKNWWKNYLAPKIDSIKRVG